MKCSLYRDMTLQDRERLVKFLLCTLLGISYSLLVGDPYSATAAVTANLFLYTDRGYYGGLRYAFKRIEVQVIQGALVLAVILPVRYWLKLPLPDTALMILASCFAIAIGLPLNYKHPIAPYHTTLANATFILATGVIHSPGAYPYRVLHCVAGFLIGYLVNYILMPQRDRYAEATERIAACTRFLLDRLQGGGHGDAFDYAGTKSLIATDVQFLKQDHERGLPRHKRTPGELALVSWGYQILDDMERLDRAVSGGAGSVSAQFWREWRLRLEESCLAHRAAMGAMEKKRAPDPPRLTELGYDCAGPDEVLLLSLLIAYRRRLLDIIGACPRSPEVSPV